MFDVDVSRLHSDVILDPYSLKDLRMLAYKARQEFVAAVMQLRSLELANEEASRKGIIRYWRETRRIEKALRVVHAVIAEKRTILGDIERALKIALTSDRDEMERREFYMEALEKNETNDDMRYESRMRELSKRINGLSANDLLAEIWKQLTELYFIVEKMDHQSKRRREWDLHGPPRSVRNEFDKISAELTRPTKG